MNLKTAIKNAKTWQKLLVLNVAVFALFQLVFLFSYLFRSENPSDFIFSLFAIPANHQDLMTRPWTLLTYMFTHFDFLHLLFNMLWLWVFAKLFQQFFSQNQNHPRLVWVYILSGLSGAVFYLIAYNTFPVFSVARFSAIMCGASASVFGIVFATAFYAPKHKIHLFLFGPVSIVYIALFSIILDLFSIRLENPGGHIAHIGGALFGFIYARFSRKGIDITAWLTKISNSFKKLFKPKPKIRVTYRRPPTDDKLYNKQVRDRQAEIDRILDKISASGYSSLTKEEKQLLFDQKK